MESLAEAEALAVCGVLVQAGHEVVATSNDDHEDAPVTLFQQGDFGRTAYYSPSAGTVEVPDAGLAVYRADMRRVLGLIGARLELPRHLEPLELVEGTLWELGPARLPRRKARMTMWFARRVWDTRVFDSITEVAKRRPHTGMRVLLTSTRPDRLARRTLAGFEVVALAEMRAADGLTADPDILSARLGSPQPASSMAGPIALSPDGTRLIINGQVEFRFRSDQHIEAIRRLVDAYRSGVGLRAGDLSPYRTLDRLFGGKRWAELRPFLHFDGALWRLQP